MLFLSAPFLAILGAVAAAAYLVRCIASPLRRVPGPTHSLFSSWALKWHEFRGGRTDYVHALHRRYGPAVRLAPNEVAFASAGAAREIYCSGGSGYDKTEFYDLFRVFGRRTMFTTLNKEDHAKRKRILADRYANSNVLRPASIEGIEARSRNFVQRCYESGGNSIDLYLYLHSYAFDGVTHHLFHPYGSSALSSPRDEEIMKEVTFDSSLQNRLVEYYSPTVHKIMGKLIYVFAKPRETPLANEFVLGASAKTDAAQFTLLSRLQDKGGSLERLDVAAELADHMVAGIDTTGDALCFLMWELSQPRSMAFQERLRDELRAAANAGAAIAGAAAGDAGPDGLPAFLDAVVLEGLRCFPAIPMSLPRYVPLGGRSVDGYFIPGHTIVSCQAYSVHRLDEAVFPQPDMFDPDRWMRAEGDAERKRLFFAFASGGRGCVGKHLALAEMKLLLRDVYARFATLPEESMTDESMRMSHQLISSRPAGQKCLLRFVPLGEDEVKA